MCFHVVIDKISYNVEVNRKDVKVVRLKVFPNGEIKLSVPLNTPEYWIVDFLEKKKSWLKNKLDLFKKTKPIEREEHIISGVSTRILGRQMTVKVFKDNKKYIVIEDHFVKVLTDENEQDKIDKQFTVWWQKSAKQFFCKVVDDLYPIIQKHNIDKPIVRVAKMKTLWGSCSRKIGKINLNYYLYRASVPCIEYVILHEMTHLLYPHHDKDFYDFLTIYMPDWQDRKKQLDFEFVRGI